MGFLQDVRRVQTTRAPKRQVQKATATAAQAVQVDSQPSSLGPALELEPEVALQLSWEMPMQEAMAADSKDFSLRCRRLRARRRQKR